MLRLAFKFKELSQVEERAGEEGEVRSLNRFFFSTQAELSAKDSRVENGNISTRVFNNVHFVAHWCDFQRQVALFVC